MMLDLQSCGSKVKIMSLLYTLIGATEVSGNEPSLYSVSIQFDPR
jgi:hypothetical protein